MKVKASERWFLLMLQDAERRSAPLYIAVTAVLLLDPRRAVSFSNAAGQYSKGDYKRAVKLLRTEQAGCSDRPEIAELYAHAVNLIRRERISQKRAMKMCPSWTQQREEI